MKEGAQVIRLSEKFVLDDDKTIIEKIISQDHACFKRVELTIRNVEYHGRNVV